MNKYVRNTIALFLSFIMVFLIGCSGVDKHSTLNNKESFKTKNDVPVVEPFAEPEPEVEILAVSQPTNITVSVTRPQPKDMSLNFNDVSATPIKPVFIKEPSPVQPDLKALKKAEKKEWRVWYRDLHKYLINLLRKDLRESLDKENTKFKISSYNLKHNSPEFKQLKKDHEETKKKLRSDHKVKVKELRETSKNNWVSIKTYLDDKYNKAKGSFSVKLLGIDDAIISLIIGGLLLLFSGITALFNSFFKSNPAPITKEEFQPQNLNTVPTTEQDDLYTTKQPVSGTEESKPKPPTQSTVTQSSNNKVLPITELLKGVTGPEQRLLASFRGNTLMEKMGINISDLDNNRYSNCRNIAAVNKSDIPTNCDYFSLSDIYLSSPEILRAISENSLEYKDKIILNFKFSANNNLSTRDWLFSSISSTYPNTLESYGSNEIAKKISDFLAKGIVFNFSIQSPKLCSNEVGIQYDFSPEIAEVLSMIKNSSVVFDGESTLSFGYTQSGTKISLGEVKANIAKTLGKSASSGDKLEMFDLERKKDHTICEDFNIDPSICNINSNNQYNDISVHVQNKLGNLWDIQISPLGDFSCKPFLNVECINSSEYKFKFKHLNYENGLYKINTKYSGEIDNNIIYGKNNSKYSNTSYPNDYRFGVLHVNYDSFALLTNKPRENVMSATYNQSDRLNTIDKVDLGIMTSYNELEDLDLADHQSVSILNIPNPDSKYRSTKVVTQSLEQLRNLQSNFFIKPSANLDQTPARDLLNELVGSETQPFKSFEGVNLNSCEKQKFLQVGAVVNLTNGLTQNNNLLFKDSYGNSQYLPLKLAIVSKNQFNETILKSWSFKAKIGSNTIVEKYWDGSIDSNTEDDLEPGENIQDYSNLNGQYQVKILFDFDYKYLDTLSKQYKAYFATPNISTSSNKALINFSSYNTCIDSCPINISTRQELISSLDNAIAEANNFRETDLLAYIDPKTTSAFTTSSINVSKPFSKPEYEIFTTSLSEYKQALENLKNAVSGCDSERIRIASNGLLEKLTTVSYGVDALGRKIGIELVGSSSDILSFKSLLRSLSSGLFVVSSTLYISIYGSDANFVKSEVKKLDENIIDSADILDQIISKLNKECIQTGITSKQREDYAKEANTIFNAALVKFVQFVQKLNNSSTANMMTVFNAEFSIVSSNVRTANVNLSALDRKITNECDPNKVACDTNDFRYIKASPQPSEKTIKCRIKYVDVNLPRQTNMVSDLKGLLDKTNFARNEVANKTSVVIDPYSSPGRTFAVARVTEGSLVSYVYAMNSVIEIKDSSGNFLANFANNLPENKSERFIKSDENLAALGFNSTHAEMKILEHIASINNNCSRVSVDKYTWSEKNRTYDVYPCKNIKVEFFTDRATCALCSSTIDNVVQNIFKGFDLRARNYDFPSGKNDAKGIFYSGEMIPRFNNGYYSSN